MNLDAYRVFRYIPGPNRDSYTDQAIWSVVPSNAKLVKVQGSSKGTVKFQSCLHKISILTKGFSILKSFFDNLLPKTLEIISGFPLHRMIILMQWLARRNNNTERDNYWYMLP